ncbi:hypothetical protein [Yoonia sp. R2-816]|uniref:hypothetical protein n=1 Tax=Yoonia sp. R2-816 TaxID=3342638 RepID=UPI003728D538
MRLSAYAFILIAGALSLATFLTSQTLHADGPPATCSAPEVTIAKSVCVSPVPQP